MNEIAVDSHQVSTFTLIPMTKGGQPVASSMSSFSSFGTINIVTVLKVWEEGTLTDAELGGLGASGYKEERGYITNEHNDTLLQSLRDCTFGDNGGLKYDVTENFDGLHEYKGSPNAIIGIDPTCLPGAPEGWIPPQPSEGWNPCVHVSIPVFAIVDNPGGWSKYTYSVKMKINNCMVSWHASTGW